MYISRKLTYLVRIWSTQSAVIINESSDSTAAIFTALQGMQMRILSVRLSVRPSVCTRLTEIMTKQKKHLS